MAPLEATSEAQAGTSSDRWQHPHSFYCPISQQVLHDPVVLSDGHTYERRHIERWLKEHSTSPVTGQALVSTEVFPNHALRNAIEEYFQQVFSEHRRAIRTTIAADEDAPGRFTASSDMLRAVDALMQCSLLVNADLSTGAILRRIMDEARALLGAEAASVFLLDSEREELYSTVNSTSGEIRIPLTAGIAGHVARTGEPIIIIDAYSDSRFNKSVDAKTGFRTRDILCVPLKAKKGGVMGVVQLVNKCTGGSALHTNCGGSSYTSTMEPATSENPDCSEEPPPSTFSADDLQFLLVFASQAATAIGSDAAIRAAPADRRSRNEETRRATSSRCLAKYTVDCLKLKATEPEPQKVEASAGRRGRAKGDEAVAGLPPVVEPESVGASAGLIPEPRVAALLRSALHTWQVDTLELAQLTGNRPLSVLGLFLFDSLGLVSRFNLDRPRLIHFLETVEHGYDENPYHNRSHAASVLHVTYAILELGGVRSRVSAGGACNDALAIMASLIAAAIHDFQHPGLNNDFLVRMHDDRAVRYNDQHVNEHHSVAAAFELLRRPSCNFLQALPVAEFRSLRRLVVDAVLGTDVTEGNRILCAFAEATSANSAGGAAGAKGGDATSTAAASTAPQGFVPATLPHASLLLQVAVKCADFSHIAMDWELHLVWVRRLEEEFFQQGDCEKELGHSPVSFLMDRSKPGASSSQVGFFNFAVIPLFRALVDAAPLAKPILDAMMSNYDNWKQLEEAKTAAPTAKAPDAGHDASLAAKRSLWAAGKTSGSGSEMQGALSEQLPEALPSLLTAPGKGPPGDGSSRRTKRSVIALGSVLSTALMRKRSL